MASAKSPAGNVANLQISGGAAIIAPASAFPRGLPSNAMVVLPMKEPKKELLDKLENGALAVTPDQMWDLLGFNGAPVQVTDQEGRPLTIGVNDLLDGLEKHWNENPSDMSRGRIFASELMRHGKPERAEKVLAKIVAKGGEGEDWLGLGVAQLAAGNLDKAEGTLKGAQNLMPDSPFPSLNLAKVLHRKEQTDEAKTMVEKAVAIDSDCVDAWVFLFNMVNEQESEDAAIKAVEGLADASTHKDSAAPYIALQGVFAADEKTRPRALEFAKKAVDRDSDNALALIALSSLYGQNGDLQAIVSLLQPHENAMLRDVRLANNYFEALLGAREMDKLTKLLNALAGSPVKEVKQFAIERSRAVAQMLQQQQRHAQAAARKAST
jgi:cytochrome c-type biogenesis protein CcmH/NrfG